MSLSLGLQGQNISLESLPKGNLQIKVVDEEGKPVHDAEVQMLSIFKAEWNTKPASSPVRGQTDAYGTVSGILPTAGTILFRASKANYYSAEGEYSFQARDGGRWYPEEAQLVATLRPVVKPVPMFARVIEGELNATNERRCINLETGKIEGETRSAAEFVFQSRREGNRVEIFLSFPEGSGKIAEVHKDDKLNYSTFKFPNTATSESLRYVSSVSFIYDVVDGVVNQISPDQSNTEGYVFEVAGRYGKVYGPITVEPRVRGTVSKTYVNISYAINRSIGETSLEWNRVNLCADQASIPAPQDP